MKYTKQINEWSMILSQMLSGGLKEASGKFLRSRRFIYFSSNDRDTVDHVSDKE